MAPSNRVTGVLTFVLIATSLILCIFNASVNALEEDEPPKIGIVGAGIGGATTAYYIRQLFGDMAVIDVFEETRVGGRLALINIDGLDYEAGATLIHPKNMYMLNFTEMLGLGPRDGLSGKLGIFGAGKMLTETSSWSMLTIAKMVWRYGWDMWKIKNWVADHIMTKFSRIYDIQDRGIAFTSVEEVLKSMDPVFVEYTKKSVKNVLIEEGFGERFIDELVMGAMRSNYGQTTDVHAFVGAVSLAGVEQGLWSVKGGNKLVPEKLLQKAGANLIMPSKVTKIFLHKDSDGIASYELEYTVADKDEPSIREYDIVIIATPLPSGQTDIEFEGFQQNPREPEMSMHQLALLYVQGKPNVTSFGYESDSDFPTEIFTTESSIFWNSFGRQLPVLFKDHLKDKPISDTEEELVYKVALNAVPNEQQINFLFQNRKDLRVVNWKAYPDYTTNMELPSFVLYDRLYYVNAIENAASAMEMSAIAGRNVALLAYNHWHSYLDKIDELHDEKSIPQNEEL